MLNLRWYQEEAVNAMEHYTGTAGVVALPTGAGKSIVIAEYVRRMRTHGLRVVNAIHNGELVRQNAAAIERHCKEPVGIVSASVGKKQHGYDIQVVGVGSAYKHTAIIGRVDILLIDECHLVSRDRETMYGKLINGLREINPSMRLIGLTATPWRMDGPIVGGGVFVDEIYSACTQEAFQRMVQEGYLAPLTKGESLVIDYAGVQINSTGDYSEAALEHKLTPLLPELIPQMLEQSMGRHKGLVFAPTVHVAEMIYNRLREMAIDAWLVTGATPKGERAESIKQFHRRRHSEPGQAWMVSVSALTTGFDVPDVDVLAIFRATTSSALNVQILGRGTRVHEDKDDCLVLDYGGNIERCGPIDAPRIPRLKGDSTGNSEAVKRTCAVCEQQCHASIKVCPTCGTPFPPVVPGSVITGTESPMATIAIRRLDDAIATVLPPTRRATLVAAKNGMQFCRIEWADNMSVLVTKSNCKALGVELGDPMAMQAQVMQRGTKPVSALLEGGGKYPKVTIGHTASPRDAWWPATTTPVMRGVFRRLVMGQYLDAKEIAAACQTAGGKYRIAQLVPDLAKLCASLLTHKYGSCTVEVFDQWVLSITGE